MANTCFTTSNVIHYPNHTNLLLFSFNSRSFSFKKPFSSSSSHFSTPLLSLSFSPLEPSPCFRLTSASTAPVECAPLEPDFNFEQEISRLKSLRSKIADSKTLAPKLAVLDSDLRVRAFFESRKKSLARLFAALNLGSRELFLFKCLVAAGQQHVLCSGMEFAESEELQSSRSSVKKALWALVEMIESFDLSGDGKRLEKSISLGLEEDRIDDLRKLIKSLGEIEQFYGCIGGIIGYQIMVLELLDQSTIERRTTNWSRSIEETMECQFLEIHAPNGIDLSKSTEYASQAALWGIEGLPDLGEFYPLGGSADRLGLVDHETGECLPAAMLPYCGRTLLEGLIRDLQAREFLYFKLFGKQCITPVAIMTSSAKNNHKHVTSLCERLGWFGRGRSNFQLFEQPMVPAVSSEDGQWLVTKPFTPVCKPGGHGVIWKLAYDKGVFKWFYDHGRRGATVRQVSNVVAATDLTLLALAGIGLRQRKKLGFASCKRISGATEGINVLIEKKNLDGKWAYGLSCIEYTEFEKFGIPSGSVSSHGLQSEFPANTNILYVDLHAVEEVASSDNEKCLPGMVLNAKKPISYVDHFGNCYSVSGGRLECTMQNIADSFLNTYLSRCYQGVEDEIDTFIVYNERRKVTSSAKRKRRHSDSSLHQTPDGSLLDILRNAYDLLSRCDIELPEIEDNAKYANSGPPYLILLHPALGPLWEIARQKFSEGSISKGSELQIEVAEFLWRNVQLEGSLIVVAENVMGATRNGSNGEPIIRYGQRCGRCKLQNVRVLNEGIEWSCGENRYWKHDVQRFEALKIILNGNAEFEAENVTIEGNHNFEVPDGYKMKITSGESGLKVQLNQIEPIMMDSGSWYWNYKIKGTHIVLELVEL
ncbi:hypothetical protein K2173_005094 [Erythroxylum novogranatense]|uniref:UGP3-like C-terminal hexapeptide repeats domain-containing protein n=1 Tax=Erythroxylum novogranatense TaxID=1862640 RepID=A0AAV8TDU5_9ROSI|nr:hypothetical protein K2173_005094 [Erythroxylum novogranatense]